MKDESKGFRNMLMKEKINELERDNKVLTMKRDVARDNSNLQRRKASMWRGFTVILFFTLGFILLFRLDASLIEYTDLKQENNELRTQLSRYSIIKKSK